MDEPFVLETLGKSRRWVLHRPIDPYGDGCVFSMRVEISDDKMSAETSATILSHSDLVSFVQRLAEDWRGWTGVRKWWSLEGEMGLDARHDGRGRVTLGVTLKRARQAYADDAWTARVVFVIEAGEEMTRLAADIRCHAEACH